ncbi:MAG: hypothetical protein AAGF71_01410 [Pseudomonadota bacterium]
MSGAGRFAAGSIEELLAGIADGVREAQESLSDLPPVDAFGRPMPSYHLPYVDFEIAVDMDIENVDTGESAESPMANPLMTLRPLTAVDLGRRLKVKTLLPTNVASQDPTRAGAEISSRIKGRLVAVPAGEGLPVPVITMVENTAPGGPARTRTLAIQAANTAGEIMANRVIELNVDWEVSAALSPSNSQPKQANPPSFSTAEVATDENGQAQVTVTLPPGPKKGTIYMITATLGQVSVNAALTV